VTASSTLPGYPAANAVDGDPDTLWNSGAGPEQWIQIELENPISVRSIRLSVAQQPEGETIHQIWAGAEVSNLALLHEFKGFTSEPGILEFAPPAAWTNIRYIRIVTTHSPSWVAWREIEVSGE
jgi:hypothetical protein